MNCVSYTRATTCMPEETIPADVITRQNERIRAYIKARHWRLRQTYSDRPKNPDAEEGFQQLRKDGLARRFEMVVVDSIYRCGRHVSMAEDLLYKVFYQAGIHFTVVEDDFCSLDHTPEEVKNYVVGKRLHLQAEVLHAHRSRETRSGLYSMHDERYGYLLSEDRTGFVIDEEAAPIIREIFQMYLAGLPPCKIAEVMNARGNETPFQHLSRVGLKHIRVNMNAKWSSGCVIRILQCTAYDGYWYKSIRGEKQKVVTPPILPEGTFAEVADLLVKNTRKSPSGGKHPPSLFSKRIIDQTTGQYMKVARLHRPTPVSYYACRKDTSLSRAELGQAIPVETVADKVHQLLVEETLRAKHAAACVESAQRDAFLNAYNDSLTPKAQEIFAQLVKVEAPYLDNYRLWQENQIGEEIYREKQENILREIETLTVSLDELLKDKKEMQKVCSLKNPWITCFKDISVPKALTREHVVQWIDKVYVVDYRDVTVDFRHSAWRNRLPAAWIEIQ